MWENFCLRFLNDGGYRQSGQEAYVVNTRQGKEQPGFAFLVHDYDFMTAVAQNRLQTFAGRVLLLSDFIGSSAFSVEVR